MWGAGRGGKPRGSLCSCSLHHQQSGWRRAVACGRGNVEIRVQSNCSQRTPRRGAVIARWHSTSSASTQVACHLDSVHGAIAQQPIHADWKNLTRSGARRLGLSRQPFKTTLRVSYVRGEGILLLYRDRVRTIATNFSDVPQPCWNRPHDPTTIHKQL